MLAEIFFLRLEAALRVTEEASPAGNTRFIPGAPSILPGAPERDLTDLATSPDVKVTVSLSLVDRADEVVE